MSQLKEQFSVVFLGIHEPPQELIFLRRESKRYGGDLMTGIGGHYDPEIDGSIGDTAVRELGEEVPAYVGAPLTEFARAIINGKKGLAYYWGLVESDDSLPNVEGNEGTLELVPVSELSIQPIFPTTMPIVMEWQARGFKTDRPWTMFIKGEEDETGVTRNVIVERIIEGLVEF